MYGKQSCLTYGDLHSWLVEEWSYVNKTHQWFWANGECVFVVISGSLVDFKEWSNWQPEFFTRVFSYTFVTIGFKAPILISDWVLSERNMLSWVSYPSSLPSAKWMWCYAHPPSFQSRKLITMATAILPELNFGKKGKRMPWRRGLPQDRPLVSEKV